MPDTQDQENRARAIEQLVERCWRELAAGMPYSAKSILERNPHLRPELDEELKRIELIVAARKQAAETDDAHHEPADTSQWESGKTSDDSKIDPLDIQRLMSSGESEHQGRFLPGTIVANRFRMLGLVGRGGMGEVYRAYDLKLGDSAALKWLPAHLSHDRRQLALFHNEVRLARQISHPNVCRVHDIGEADGHHFLSMEFVDGEDLAGLLRRIHRLPEDKGIQVARQICAGLSAAHAQGVLHRDLKPGNIMLDGRGQVRITDFGLAHRADQATDAKHIVGTPAYMSPEQAAKGTVSVRSDVYALGLVMFELFTGERVWNTNSLDEVVKLHKSAAIPPPTSIVRELDPDVETAILQCLEKDPQLRPRSALEVAAALPGSDALAAMLAAGETPEPAMVAIAGTTGALKPWVAGALLLAILCSLVAGVALSPQLRMIEHATPSGGARLMPVDPDVLKVNTQQFISAIGYPVDKRRDHTAFNLRWTSPNVVRAAYDDESDWSHSVGFWYRQSPKPLLPGRRHLPRANTAVMVSLRDPPLDVPGMVTVRMDAMGRLLEFKALPLNDTTRDARVQSSDDVWDLFFEMSKIKRGDYVEQTPDETGTASQTPPVSTDQQTAWTIREDATERGIARIEAGTLNGRATWWRTFRTEAADSTSTSKNIHFAEHFDKVIYVLVMVAGLFLAERNRRLGRSDVKGAFRIALFVFAVYLVNWVLVARHVFAPKELDRFRLAVAVALFWATSLWILYVALEPYVRKWRPELLISWSRLLAGRWRDPLVGRDVLIGCCVAFVSIPVLGIFHVVTRGLLGLHWTPAIPAQTRLELLFGARYLGSVFCDALLNGLYSSSTLLIFPFVLLPVVRKPAIAVGAALLTFTVFSGSYYGDGSVYWLIYMGLWMALFLGITYRFGLLASAVMIFTFHSLVYIPVTKDAIWYAEVAWGGQAVLLLISLFGFYVSLGGQRMFRDIALDR